jgi:uncharacterized membrane protein
LLWGLSLAAVPIIIYLLNRRRFKRVIWAAMEFLLQAMKKNRRRLRIENLLLLIIRTLIVLLFVMAIARPLIKSRGFFDILDRFKKNLVLVVDNSYSMGYKTGPTTSFERGLKWARSLVETLESGDKISIVFMNSLPEPLYESPVTIAGDDDKKSIQTDMSSVRLSSKTTNVPRTLDKVVEILDKFEPEAAPGQMSQEKTVYVITDCQVNGWSQEGALAAKHLKKIAEQFRRRKADLQVLDVGEREAPNFAVIGLKCDRALVGTDIPVTFEATLKNFSKTTFPDVVVSLTVDDLPQQDVTINLDPGEPRKLLFNYLFKDRGYHYVRVEAKTDHLGTDNEAYLAINVHQSVEVLVVDGRHSVEAWESESDYIKAFFYAGVSVEGKPRILPFRETIRTHMEFESLMQGDAVSELRQYDIILLANLSDLTPEAVAALTTYVEEGGSVLMFLGDTVIPERYNQFMYQEGAGILPAKLKDVKGDRERLTPISLEIQSYDHPTMKFFENWPLALRRPMAFMYFDCEPPTDDKSTTVIASYDDKGEHAPAILEKKFGRGRVLLVTNSAWDDRWNNWNKYQFFPIFLSEALSYLSHSAGAKLNYLVGQAYQRILTAQDWASEVYVMPPTEESIKKNLKKLTSGEGGNGEDAQSARFQLTHAETDTPGIYKVVFTGGQGMSGMGERTENFAVNVNTSEESDMTKLIQSELQAAMPALTDPKPEIKHHTDVTGDLGKGTDEAGGREFWKHFIIAVLALLALESLLAQRFGKYEK